MVSLGTQSARDRSPAVGHMKEEVSPLKEAARGEDVFEEGEFQGGGGFPMNGNSGSGGRKASTFYERVETYLIEKKTKKD